MSKGKIIFKPNKQHYCKTPFWNFLRRIGTEWQCDCGQIWKLDRSKDTAAMDNEWKRMTVHPKETE